MVPSNLTHSVIHVYVHTLKLRQLFTLILPSKEQLLDPKQIVQLLYEPSPVIQFSIQSMEQTHDSSSSLLNDMW